MRLSCVYVCLGEEGERKGSGGGEAFQGKNFVILLRAESRNRINYVEWLILDPRLAS